MVTYRALVALAMAAGTLGCASTSGGPAHAEMTKETAARGAPETRWLRGGPEDAAVKQSVQRILDGELTIEGAVQVALWNDRNLQIVFEELGIAQADLVQAGLLPNPTLSVGYGFPLSSGQPGIQIDLVTSIASLVTLSARKGVARAQMEAARLRVGHEVLRVVFETRVAFVRAQAALQTLSMRRAILDSAQASLTIHRKAHEAGNINDLTLANEEALVASLTLDVKRAEVEAIETREAVHRRLGVWGVGTSWRAAAKVAEMPVVDPSSDDAESRAITFRLDLAATRADVEAVSQGLHYTKQGRFLPGLSAGVAFERGAEGFRLLGPTVSVDLPLFDRGQAQVARLEAQLRQAQARQYATAVEVRSSVREARAKLVTSRAIVEAYRDSVVPLRERVVALSQQQYDAMLLGVHQLIQAKQAEVAAFADFIAALRDYWIARFALEQAAGGPLPVPATSMHSPTPAVPAGPPPAQHPPGHEGHAP